jgi:hypothetical protein
MRDVRANQPRVSESVQYSFHARQRLHFSNCGTNSFAVYNEDGFFNAKCNPGHEVINCPAESPDSGSFELLLE